MRVPLTSKKIAAAFGGCCRLNEGDVVLETAEEKEQRIKGGEENLRDIFDKLDEDAEERKREKQG